MWRRRVQLVVLFGCAVVLVNGLIGERGVVQLVRARRHYQELAASVGDLKRQNLALGVLARRLRDDPAAVEALARRDLGLVRPGEIVVVIQDRRHGKP